MPPKEEEIVPALFKDKLPHNSIVSIIYDTYSSAWMLGFAFLKKEIDAGGFVSISNYNLPLPNLLRAGSLVGLDIQKEIEKENIIIIDVFGSKYDVKFNMKNIFYLENVDPETINPKINILYSKVVLPKIGNRAVVRLVHTLDGAAFMLGEDVTLKLLNATIAEKTRTMPSSVLVLPINRDVVSKKFVAWVASLSDYVIVASSKLRDEGLDETLHVVKAPFEDFEPTAYKLRATKGKRAERLKIKKINL
ncbi:hypothetical protein [Thermococcus sp.]